MADDRVVISSASAVTPESVASRSFATGFRGYDQGEVKAFLKRVGDELAAAAGREAELRRSVQEALDRAAHPHLDEDVITNALGEHAARLLSNAREAANAIVSEAETRAARMLHDAEAKIARVRAEGDSLLARRTEECERLTSGMRQAAETDARTLRDRARAESEAEVEAARVQGRDMVSEARSLRERMLSDLSRRKRVAEAQVEQLRAIRHRLLDAYGVVRRTLEEATNELLATDAAARPPAEGLLAGPLPTPLPSSPAASLAAPPVFGPAPPPAHSPPPARPAVVPPAPLSPAPAPPAPSSAPPAPFSARPGVVAGDVRSGAAPGADVRPGPGSTPWSSPRISAVPVAAARDSSARRASEAELSAAPSGPSGAADPGLVPAASGADTHRPAHVEELFARMRAATAEESRWSPAEAPAEPVDPHPPRPPAPANVADIQELAPNAPRPAADQTSPEDPSPSPPPSPSPKASTQSGPGPGLDVADESALFRRDELLDPIEADLARQLKRALQDEQNEVLDRLRRQRQPVLDATLPDPMAQAERFAAVAAPLLRQAARKGSRFVASGDNGEADDRDGPGEPADRWAAELVADVVVPLRERLERVLREAVESGDDRDVGVADRVSATYRQCKVSQIEPTARHYVSAAFVQGAYRATPEDVSLRWVVDDEAPCPDCDDNALAGPTAKGQAFPTGQAYPPAHPGCRCLLLPALP